MGSSDFKYNIYDDIFLYFLKMHCVELGQNQHMNHVLYLGFLGACKHSAEIIVYVSHQSKYTLVPLLKQALFPGLRIAEGVKGVGQTYHQFLQFIDGVVISAISAFVSILTQFVRDVQSIVPRYVESSATEST